MNKFNKTIRKYKVTKENFKDFSKIASLIPKGHESSMVLCITTWEENQTIHKKQVLW